jgi:RimJ/RimL family protein N-acetyltransferase
MTILLTPRLRLEPITEAHFEGMHRMNSRPEVMRHISGMPETPEQTRASIERVKTRWADWGFSWWALIERDSGELVGAGGVQYLGHEPGNPLELGWRLHPDHWGKGYASEAARVMAQYAFDQLDAPLVCAVRHPDNAASARVMERLGMSYQGIETWYGTDTAVYRVTREEWERQP